jgi:glycerol kinase
MRETTALGVCFAAGCAVGIWKGVDDLIHLKYSAMDLDVFDPQSTEEGKEG